MRTAYKRRIADAVPKDKLSYMGAVLGRGTRPRLIDEWQLAPQFWDAVRFKVDHSAGFGQFILAKIKIILAAAACSAVAFGADVETWRAAEAG